MTNEAPMKFQMLCETEVDFKKKLEKKEKNDIRRQQLIKELCGASRSTGLG